MFRALASRDFRLYYFGQGISFTGNLVQEMALSWFVYKLTGEAFYVGLLFFGKQIAAFFMAPFAGVLADKISMRTILIATNSLLMLLAVVMGIIVLTNYNVVWWILIVQFINGLVSGIDVPVRQAFVKELVPDDSQLINAIALNSSLFNIARILSPLLAGILIPVVGEGMCMMINAATFSGVIAGIVLITNKQKEEAGSITLFQSIWDGMSYTFSHDILRMVMIVTAGISFFGFPFTVLLPAFTKEILNGEAQVLGLLTTAMGVGSLLSGLYMASKKSSAGLSLLIFFACLVYGLGLIQFSSFETVYWAMIALVQIGLGQVLIYSSCSSIIQTISERSMTGRVISLYIMTYMGATTIGFLTIGALANYFGTLATLILCGSGCISIAIYLFASVRSLRKRILVILKIKKSPERLSIEEVLP